MESNITRRICGTCVYWNGYREPIPTKNKVAIIDEVGRCHCPVSSKSGQERKNQLSCKCYENFNNR